MHAQGECFMDIQQVPVEDEFVRSFLNKLEFFTWIKDFNPNQI